MASLSVEKLGDGRFKVRWREWVATDGGERKRVARSLTVNSREAAAEVQGKIVRAIETVGFYEPEGRPERLVGNLEKAGEAWLNHKAARGCAPSTIKKYGTSLTRLFAAIRKRDRIKAEAVVPTTVLSRELFADIVNGWRKDKLSESSIYSTSLAGYEVWTWAADEPATYPGVPVPPRDASRVLPQPPMYMAPTPPTIEEADACLRHLSKNAYIARPVGIVMRFTGLRVSQVLAIRARDVNLVRAEIRVTSGKSRREKAEQRVIPVSRHLIDEIAELVKEQPADAPLIKRRKDQRAPLHANHLPGTPLGHGWEAAWKAGHVRREVFEPPNRKIARPEHAFRAAFQAFLEGEAVRDSVIDFLVGHSPKSVRGRHYAPPVAEQLRAAVDLLPPIDWEGPDEVEEQPNNVVPMRR